MKRLQITRTEPKSPFACATYGTEPTNQLVRNPERKRSFRMVSVRRCPRRSHCRYVPCTARTGIAIHGDDNQARRTPPVTLLQAGNSKLNTNSGGKAARPCAAFFILFRSSSSFAVKCFMHVAQMRVGYVGIHLCSRNICMAKQCLHAAQVGTVGKQICCK